MLNEDNEKIELTPTQQNPGNAKPEDFEVGNEGNPGGGQYGDTPAERKKLMRERESKRRSPYKLTPDRNTPDHPERPKTGSRLK